MNKAKDIISGLQHRIENLEKWVMNIGGKVLKHKMEYVRNVI